MCIAMVICRLTSQSTAFAANSYSYVFVLVIIGSIYSVEAMPSTSVWKGTTFQRRKNMFGPREKFSRHALHRSWPDVHVDAHCLPSQEPQESINDRKPAKKEPQKALKIEIFLAWWKSFLGMLCIGLGLMCTLMRTAFEPQSLKNSKNRNFVTRISPMFYLPFHSIWPRTTCTIYYSCIYFASLAHWCIPPLINPPLDQNNLIWWTSMHLCISDLYNTHLRCN